MDRNRFSTSSVGNDFYIPAPRLQAAAPAVSPVAPAISVVADATPLDYEYVDIPQSHRGFGRALDFMHTYTLGTFAAMFLVIGATSTVIAGNYYGNRIIADTPVSHLTHNAQPLAGLNMSIPSSELVSKVQAITNQSLTIQMGSTTETIPAATVHDWLQIVSDKSKGVSYIHVKDQNISALASSRLQPQILRPRKTKSLSLMMALAA